MPVIPVLGRLKQEDHEVQANLGYIERHYLKKEKQNLGWGWEEVPLKFLGRKNKRNSMTLHLTPQPVQSSGALSEPG